MNDIESSAKKVRIVLYGAAPDHTIETEMTSEEFNLVLLASDFIGRVDADDRIRIGVYWPHDISLRVGRQELPLDLEPTLTELFIYGDHISFGYAIQDSGEPGILESEDLSIEELTEKFS